MRASCAVAAVILLLLGSHTAGAQAPKSGGEILATKCAQCHSDAMWRDQRQDRRAWEATLYRMVGRGAAWELAEIGAMADYLGGDFGPDAPTAASAPARK